MYALELVISIHAPHTGRDADRRQGYDDTGRISIHAPHTGRDLKAIIELIEKCDTLEELRESVKRIMEN